MLCQSERQRLSVLVEELALSGDRDICLALRRELGLLARYLRLKKFYTRRTKKGIIGKKLKILGIGFLFLLGAVVSRPSSVDMTEREIKLVASVTLNDEDFEE